MEIVNAIILGVAQGLSEFLPISSSAHLILIPWLFNFPDPGLTFDLALHWGTLVAVFVYFRNDILLFLKGFGNSLFKSTRDFQNNIYQKLSWFVALATVPGVIAGFLLAKQAESTFRNPLLIAVTLSLGGILLFIFDYISQKEKNLNRMSGKDAFMVGVGQAFAIIPGISRSGATMITALALKFKREDAARFSFLLSIPIILGAGLSKVNELVSDLTSPTLLVGFIASAISGYLAIKYMLRYITKHNFNIFVWYRLVLAIIILIVYFVR